MKAARSSRSLRARRISINPENDSRQYRESSCIFATVERFTAAICSNALFDVTQIWSYARERDKKSRRVRGTLRLLSQFLSRVGSV
jgi:hypothetical protein